MKRLYNTLRPNKNTIHRPLTSRVVVLFVSLLVFAGYLLPVASYAAVAEAFVSDKQLAPGTIVSAKKDQPQQIEIATTSNEEYLLGIVSSQQNSSVLYGKTGSNVVVALSGEVDTFVTDANGDIKTGDPVILSNIEGIGMKLSDFKEQRVVGVAVSDFDSSKARDYATSKDGDGATKVRVGVVRLRIYDKPTYAKDLQKVQKAGLVGALSDFAGKDVSYVRSVISLFIFVLCLILTAIFLILSLHGSFISLGRNPLAGAEIFRSLSRVTLLSIGIVTLGTALSYAVLVV